MARSWVGAVFGEIHKWSEMVMTESGLDVNSEGLNRKVRGLVAKGVVYRYIEGINGGLGLYTLEAQLYRGLNPVLPTF